MQFSPEEEAFGWQLGNGMTELHITCGIVFAFTHYVLDAHLAIAIKIRTY